MFWYFIAFIGAIVTAVYYALAKKAVEKIDIYWFSAVLHLGASLILFAIEYFGGFPALGPRLWLGVAGSTIIGVISTILYLKALRISDISLSLPMLSFTPLFLIGTSFIMVDEFPSHTGIIGILLIVGGSYILNLDSGKGPLAPFKSIWKNKGIMLMLAVSFLFSLGANFDKISLQNSSPIFAGALSFLCIGSVFFAISLFKAKNKINALKKEAAYFILPALCAVLMAVLMMTAMKYILVSYAISIKRISIVFTTLFGFLFFKEKHIMPRLIGSLVMVCGAMLIALS